jgi:cytochrome c-type biogenesis protein CcmH/NrfG
VLGLAVVAFGPASTERVASAAALVAESVLAQPPECADRAWVEGFLRSAAERQVACNPRSVRGWTRLAEWHVRDGDAPAAQDAARRALAADDSYALDPLRMLARDARGRLQAIADGEVISPAPSAPPR